MTPDPHLTTAAQRPPTGFDDGTRRLLVRVVGDLVAEREDRTSATKLMTGEFFRNNFGSLEDYLDTVEHVWGTDKRIEIAAAIVRAESHDPLSPPDRQAAGEATRTALLGTMPEPDFRAALELALQKLGAPRTALDRINEICRRRGIPWRISLSRMFEWVGDAVIEHHVIEPALTVLQDLRFASGVAVEFAQARAELRLGTREALKQALAEGANSVESAMKVVLVERGLGHGHRDTAHKLFERLRDGGLVTGDCDQMLLAVARARNSRAGHGGGTVAHTVAMSEAEAFIAAAAVAITFLGGLLP